MKDNKIVLTEGQDMTLTRLVEWLNENFKKSSGKPFNSQDVHWYVERGNLPLTLGHWKLKKKEYPKIGVKIVTVIDCNKHIPGE